MNLSTERVKWLVCHGFKAKRLGWTQVFVLLVNIFQYIISSSLSSEFKFISPRIAFPLHYSSNIKAKILLRKSILKFHNTSNIFLFCAFSLYSPHTQSTFKLQFFPKGSLPLSLSSHLLFLFFPFLLLLPLFVTKIFVSFLLPSFPSMPCSSSSFTQDSVASTPRHAGIILEQTFQVSLFSGKKEVGGGSFHESKFRPFLWMKAPRSGRANLHMMFRGLGHSRSRSINICFWKSVGRRSSIRWVGQLQPDLKTVNS